MKWDISVESIRCAYDAISAHIVNTPIISSATFSDICGCTTLFKLENLQMTGAFKERGALNRLLSLTEEERRNGIITASAGNHAQAVAYHAHRLGISAKIVMPVRSPLVKIRATEHWGAEVTLQGDNFDEAAQHSMELKSSENRTYIHPFDDPRVVEGQGTLAIEVLANNLGQDVEVILVPVGGGGLISGIATYIKETNPHIKVIGVEEANCDSMGQSKAAHKVVTLAPAPVIADGIAVRKVSEHNLETVLHYVDDMVSVSSDEIANAIMLMLEIEKLVIEGAAAVTLAALLNHRVPGIKGKKVLSIISGGNIDVNLLARIINRGLSFDGRVAALNVNIRDEPGSLEQLLGIFREMGANVLEVQHHRFFGNAPIGEIGVSITIETRNREHIEEIKALLSERGYVN